MEQNIADHDMGFRMSRIRAEGWNAARSYSHCGNPGDEKKIAALNPYHAELERANWYTGFNSALDRM